MQDNINKFSAFLKKAKNICIFVHHKPDGDAIGAAMAFARFFEKQKKKVTVISPSRIPDYISFITKDINILNYQRGKSAADLAMMSADLFVFCDLNDFKRTDNVQFALKKQKKICVLIDHHINPNEKQFDIMFSDTSASSTCEIAYSILADLDKKNIDKDIADALFVGIMTDTGSFSYSCNHRKVFDTVANLVDFGIDIKDLNQKIYYSNSEHQLRLRGFAQSERLKILPEYRTAYIYLSVEDLQEFQYEEGDTEGIVQFPLSLKDIEFAALFSEVDGKDKVRMSFRSKSNFNVNLYSKTLFGGGGHFNAAGAIADMPLQDVLTKFEASLKDTGLGL
jgi:phosphoesterase RecJ-like protein